MSIMSHLLTPEVRDRTKAARHRKKQRFFYVRTQGKQLLEFLGWEPTKEIFD